MMQELRNPRVSVRIPVYNHEKYVAECLESVLNQTFQDFEILITDDGSTDRSVEVIRSFTDPRIHLNVFPENQGCNVAIADCGRRARGTYMANLCSDDAWEPDKLEKQVRFLDEHLEIDAVFTKVRIIDENGADFTRQNHPYYAVFDVENRDRDQWLRYFFLHGNCLCIPSVMIRTAVYQSLQFQDQRLASLGDFDLWIRFALDHDLHILDERLTRFRVRDNEANASGDRIDNHIRTHFEYKQLMRHFLQITSADRLLRIFPECETYGHPSDETVAYCLARRGIDAGDRFRQLWGLETLFDLMADEGMATNLARDYGFRYKDLHRLTASIDVFALGAEQVCRRQIEQTQAKLDQLAKQMAERERLIQEREAHFAALQQSFADQSQEAQAAAHQQAALHAEIDAMQATISWRVTKPLRIIRAWMNRLK